MTTIYVFGNPYLNEDNLAPKIVQNWHVVSLDFKICSDPEDLPLGEHILFILDTADVAEIMVLRDINMLSSKKRTTTHDLDLGFFLQLQQKLGNLPQIVIFLIPQTGDVSRLRLDLLQLFRQMQLII